MVKRGHLKQESTVSHTQKLDIQGGRYRWVATIQKVQQPMRADAAAGAKGGRDQSTNKEVTIFLFLF